MDSEDLENWANSYIEIQTDPKTANEDHLLFWAVDRFFDLGETDPEACWSAILKILSKRPPDSVTEILAAGPLEDLIAVHGDIFVDRIEAEAKIDSEFRALLGGVWQNTTSDEVWARIQKCRGAPW